MINVSQLRIGNWVYRDLHSNEQIITIEEIRRSDAPLVRYLIKEHLAIAYENELSGIPLTEKWMEKFGMVTLDNEIDQIVWGFEGPKGEKICYVSNGLHDPLPIFFEYDSGVQDIRKELKYVHELQNLHFSITGDELQIK